MKTVHKIPSQDCTTDLEKDNVKTKVFFSILFLIISNMEYFSATVSMFKAVHYDPKLFLVVSHDLLTAPPCTVLYAPVLYAQFNFLPFQHLNK